MAAERFASLEVALYVICLAAPLALGGVHTETQLVLSAVALLLFLVTGLVVLSKRGLRVSPLAWVMVVALGWTAFQVLPLPAFLVGLVSPAARALRDELTPGRSWMPLTLDRAATALELAKQVGYVCVFLVGTEVLRRNGASKRTAVVLAGLGGGVAMLIAVHRLLGSEKIYGLYALHSVPGSGFFAPFVNGNHAAALLSLCALAAAGAAVQVRGAARIPLALCGLGAALALVATTSRGGAIGLAFGVLVLVTLLARMQYGTLRALLLSAGVTVVLCGGALLVADGLRARFTQRLPGNSLAENQKTRGWQTALHLTGRYFVTGVGRGAFEAPAAELRADDEQVRLVYPENVILQCASEWGAPITLALMLVAVAGLLTALRRASLDPPLVGLAAGVVAVLVHELFDFSLEFPGVALPWVLALAAVIAAAEQDRPRRRPRQRVRSTGFLVTGAIGLALLLLGLTARTHTLAAELESLRVRVEQHDPNARQALDAAILRHPASAELEMLAGANALRQRDPVALRHLNRAMRLQPSAGRPHQLAAVELRRVGRVRQAALEFRLAAERGAVIDNEHLIPLLGAAVVDAVPKTAEAQLQLAARLVAHQMIDAAEIAFARAAELDPGPTPRELRLKSLPMPRKLEAADAIVAAAKSGDELALAVAAYREGGALDRAEGALRAGLTRFSTSASLAVEASRVAEARGDLEAARAALAHATRFDHAGKVLVERRALELAEHSHDVDSIDAARSRLRLLTIEH